MKKGYRKAKKRAAVPPPSGDTPQSVAAPNELGAEAERTEAEGEAVPAEEAEGGSPLDRLRPGERAALLAALTARLRREAAAEEDRMAAALAESDPSYAEMETRRASMRALPELFPFLAELGVRDRLIAAYHIDRSLHPQEKGAEERLCDLLTDPGLLTALSRRLSALVAEKRQTLPPVAARAGVSLPPADGRTAPRDLHEAATAARRALGISDNERKKRSM